MKHIIYFRLQVNHGNGFLYMRFYVVLFGKEIYSRLKGHLSIPTQADGFHIFRP